MKESEKSKNEAAVREEKIQKQSKDAQSAKLKALEADHIQSRLKDMFPKVTNWQRASRQQVLEGFKLIPKIQSEFDKMLAAYHTAEKDGFGLTIPGINMDSLRNNVNTMKAKVKDAEFRKDEFEKKAPRIDMFVLCFEQGKFDRSI